MNREYSDRFLEVVSTAATPQISDPQTILHRAYDFIIQGKFDEFGESLAEDAELNICGFGPMHGAWRGRKEVIEATRRNFSLVAGQQPEIEGMISQGDSVAVLLRETGVLKSSGQAYSIRAVQWFTFVEGKIKRIDEVIASIWRGE